MLNKFIAMNLIKAQVASDGGKNDPCSLLYKLTKIDNMNTFEHTFKKGYNVKDSCILKAIGKIIDTKDTGFSFYVKRSFFSGYKRTYSYLIYFNFKIDGKREQLSFHSFSPKFKKYCKETSKFKTRWNKASCDNTAYTLFTSVFR